MVNSTFWGLFLYAIIGIIIWVVSKIIWKKKEKQLPIKSSSSNTLYRQNMYNEHWTKTKIALCFWCLGLEIIALCLIIAVARAAFLPPITILAIITMMFLIVDMIIIIKEIANLYKSKKL